MKAMPLSVGISEKNDRKAPRPPAEAPMPTIKWPSSPVPLMIWPSPDLAFAEDGSASAA